MWYDKIMRIDNKIKDMAKKLRTQGKTASEINTILGTNIPKSTLSTWFKKITLSKKVLKEMEEKRKETLRETQKRAVLVQNIKRKNDFLELVSMNKQLSTFCNERNTAKIVLATLYLCEGTKNKRSAIVFGNSDPLIIKLFLRLLRNVFNVDEKKFRCTLQGREDQNTEELENFWSSTTGIPRTQFYKARIDARTKGKISKKPEYKGVCRIDYLSAAVFHEIMAMCKVITSET